MKLTHYNCVLLLAAALVLNGQTEINRPHNVQVKVLDSKGQPVDGAVVRLYSGEQFRAGLRVGAESEELKSADAKGIVEFSRTNRTAFTLVAGKSGLSLGWIMANWGPPGWALAEKNFELILTPPLAVSGTVRDAEGKPVPEARVWVCGAFQPGKEREGFAGLLTPSAGEKYLSTTTGTDGRFRIDGLPEGAACELGAAKAGLAQDQKIYQLEFNRYSFRAGQSNITLILRPAASIEGVVIQENTDAPVAGVRVMPMEPDIRQLSAPSTITGPDGKFHLAGLGAGHYTLRAFIDAEPFPDWVCQPVMASVEAGSTNSGVKIIASRGGVIEVMVQDNSHNLPVQNASVSVNGLSYPMPALTSEQGVARLRLAAGYYYGSASKEGWGSHSFQAQVENGQTNRLSVSLQTNKTISGTVVDPEGHPAPNLRVTAIASARGQARTDAQGRFTLSLTHSAFLGSPDQSFNGVLVVCDPVRNLAATVNLTEDSANVILKLEPGLVLAGRALDDAGRGVTNAYLDLIFRAERLGMSLGPTFPVDAEGRFEIKGLPRRSGYRVNARAQGFGQEYRNVEAGETDVTRVDLEPFHLPIADQRVAGMVVDAEDKPVVGASVSASGERQSHQSARTDAEGWFSFERLCAGTVTLSAQSPLNRNFGRITAESGDTNVVIRMGTARRTIQPAAPERVRMTGKVTDPDGQAAPGVLVRLIPFSDSESQTDQGGAFRISYQPNFMGGSREYQRMVIARDLVRNLAAALEVDSDSTNAEPRLAPALALTGRVTDMGGQPIPNTKIITYLYAGSMGSQVCRPVQAGPDGSFEIKALPTDRRYSLNVSAPGYGQDSRGFTPGETEICMDLEPFQLILADQCIAGRVVDEKDKPVPGANLHSYGNKQPSLNGQTDSKGRFRFEKVCPGPIRLSVSSQSGAHAQVTAEGGDTNILVQLSSSSRGQLAVSRAISLKGKPLPDLAPFGVTIADAPKGRPILVLLMDVEQRPSRRALKLAADQAALLRAKGVTAVVIQAGAITEEAFSEWKGETDLAFPIGRMKEASPKTRAAWGASALPWLILTDKDHLVVAEGFAPEELEAKLKTIIQ